MAQTPQEYLAAGGTLTNGQIPTMQAPTNQEPQPISVSSLSSNPTPIVPVIPPQSGVPSISGLDTSVDTTKLSTPEQSVSDLIKSITDLQNKDTGKTAYTAEQEAAQGLPALRDAQTSLSKRILALQAENQNVPLQQTIEGQGRRSIGDINALSAMQLRENAIKANILSAQLDASKLDVASAQDKVDRAVALKFGPQEEEIKAKLANLEILLKDPSLTLAEKNRANAQAIALEKAKTQVAQAKQNATDIWNISTTAAQNLSNFQKNSIYSTPDQALQAIENAKTKEEALQIATATGLTKPPVALSDFEQAFMREHGRLPNVAELTAYKQNISGMTPVPLGPTQLGTPNAEGRYDAALNGLSQSEAATVKLLVDYRMPLPQGFALKSPYFQRLLGAAAQYDPTFDATQYNVRLKLKQDFNSGKAAQNIRSLNTVIGHLDSLNNATNALSNSPLQLWNQIANYGLTQIGDSRVTNFEKAANAVVTELATVFKGTGGTDQEIKAWRDTINSSQSPEQLQGGIQKLIELIASRMDALSTQYETGIGKPKDFHLLNDKAIGILTKMGVDVNSLDPISTGIQSGGDGDYNAYLKAIQ